MWQYGPTAVVFIGAVIVAGGTFWSSWRQSNFNSELREKNEKIQQLQENALQYQMGASDLKIIVSHNSTNNKQELVIVNSNELPVYDVSISIIYNIDMNIDNAEQLDKLYSNIVNPDTYNLGNISGKNAKMTRIYVDPGKHQINVNTRNSKYAEILSFGFVNGVLGYSYSIRDLKGRVIDQETLPDDFPKVY